MVVERKFEKGDVLAICREGSELVMVYRSYDGTHYTFTDVTPGSKNFGGPIVLEDIGETAHDTLNGSKVVGRLAEDKYNRLIKGSKMSATFLRHKTGYVSNVFGYFIADVRDDVAISDSDRPGCEVRLVYGEPVTGYIHYPWPVWYIEEAFGLFRHYDEGEKGNVYVAKLEPERLIEIPADAWIKKKNKDEAKRLFDVDVPKWKRTWLTFHRRRMDAFEASRDAMDMTEENLDKFVREDLKNGTNRYIDMIVDGIVFDAEKGMDYPTVRVHGLDKFLKGVYSKKKTGKR